MEQILSNNKEAASPKTKPKDRNVCEEEPDWLKDVLRAQKTNGVNSSNGEVNASMLENSNG